jgi:hypothetical protein
MIARADCTAIISAILALAHGLAIDTTAEGVEQIEQMQRLRRSGVGSLQATCSPSLLPSPLSTSCASTGKWSRQRPEALPAYPSSPVGTLLFSLSSFMPAASAMVSISAAKSFSR